MGPSTIRPIFLNFLIFPHLFYEPFSEWNDSKNWETREVLTTPQETADLVTFTEEILNGKLRFLCSIVSLPKCTILRPRIEHGQHCTLLDPAMEILCTLTIKKKWKIMSKMLQYI